MPLRKRCAKRRNDVLHPRLPRGNRIHIPLDDDCISLARDCAVCTVKSEEQLAFVKDRRLRRIEIFRHGTLERTPAEGDDAPALIRNWDDDAVAEAVIDALAALTPHGKSRRHKEVLGNAALLERVGEL